MIDADILKELTQHLADLVSRGEPVDLRFSAGGFTGRIIVTGAADDADDDVRASSRGCRFVPVDIADREAEVLALFQRERRKLQAKEIATLLGRENDSRFRNMLAKMRMFRCLLDNDHEAGYYPTTLGLVSLRAWRERQEELFGERPKETPSEQAAHPSPTYIRTGPNHRQSSGGGNQQRQREPNHTTPLPHDDDDQDGDTLTDEQLAERIAAARSARLNGVNGHRNGDHP